MWNPCATTGPVRSRDRTARRVIDVRVCAFMANLLYGVMGYWGANEGLLSGLSLHTHLLILLRIAIVLQLLPRIS